MKYHFLKFSFIYTFLLISCASSARQSYVFRPGLEGALPVIEAIDYPSSRLNSVDESYCVNIFLANLFYGKRYGENGISFIHGYGGLKEINLTLSFNGNVLSFYNIDLNEYSKQENGIIWNNANKAGIKDFSLCYPFDLQNIVKDEINSRITFKIVYKSENEVSIVERGKKISFDLVKTQSFIEIGSFNYSYIYSETNL